MAPTETHDQAEKCTQPSLRDPGSPLSNVEASNNEDGVAPQDGGRGAWTFLFGASIVEISAWGMIRV